MLKQLEDYLPDALSWLIFCGIPALSLIFFIHAFF